MAKYDLSSAIDYASQLPELQYNNIGRLTQEMVSAGFDQKVAKTALMLVFKENPQLKQHLKSGGVNALQAAKAMFEANIELGEILDKLLEVGYLKDEAVDAVKSINLDEGDQDVTKFTEKPHEDNAYADYADVGYVYDDISPRAIRELITFAEEDKSSMNPETVRNILEKHDVSQNSISQLNKELFAKEASGSIFDDDEQIKSLILGGGMTDPDIRAVMTGGLMETHRPYDALFGMITNHLIRSPEDFVNWILENVVGPYNQQVMNEEGDYAPNLMIEEKDVNWQGLWNWMLDNIQDYWREKKQQEESREPEYDEKGNKIETIYMGADPEYYDQYRDWKVSSIKYSVDLSWRDIGLSLQDFGVDKDQIITILKENGASDEEAHAAALPREGEEEETEEEPYGAMSDAPEDLDLGASGDFPYSAGMDIGGPGGLNDSLEGAPGPNDFSGTGGGYMGAPDDVADGDFFAEAPSGSGSEGGNFFEDMAKDYIAKDPQMTRGDIVEILKNEGADKQEANQVADKLKIEDDPSIRPGVFVRAGVGVGRVSSVWDTMYGKMANVISDKDGMEYEFLVEDIEILDEQKTSSVEDDLFIKITNHLSGDWYDSLEKTSGDYRDTYSSRIKTARSLLSEINTRLATTKDIGQMGLLTEARSAIDNEILFCQAKLTNTDFMGEEEYVNSRPKYEFAREASLGNAIGPGGGESMVLIADDMEREAAATNWNDVLIIDSIEFVNNLSSSLIGDAQEVARIAFNEFAPRVASVEDGKRQDLISEFMKNVEDVRRRVVAEVKAPAGMEDDDDKKDDDDKEKKDETTKDNYKKNKAEGEKLLEKKKKHERGDDISWGARAQGLDHNNKRKNVYPLDDYERQKYTNVKKTAEQEQFRYIHFLMLHGQIKRAKELGFSQEEAVQSGFLAINNLSPDLNGFSREDWEKMHPGINDFAMEAFNGDKRLLDLLKDYNAYKETPEPSLEDELDFEIQEAEEERRIAEDPEYRREIEQMWDEWDRERDFERSPEGRYKNYWDTYKKLDNSDFYKKDQDDDEGWLL